MMGADMPLSVGRRRTIALVAGFVVTMVAVYVAYTSWGYSRHEVVVDCNRTDQNAVHFSVTPYGVNSVENFICWSDQSGEPLWAFAFRPSAVNPTEISDITYGQLPTTRVKVWQYFPEKGKPRPLIPGEGFTVQVGYLYDTAFPPAASGGRSQFRFAWNDDGSIRTISKSRGGVMPDRTHEVFRKRVGPDMPHDD
jgi:hypothetical protein